MEHEQQNQVTDAYFVTYTRHNPCSNSACQHIRDITHYHCTWVCTFKYTFGTTLALNINLNYELLCRKTVGLLYYRQKINPLDG